MARKATELTHAEKTFTISVASDGTHTTAQVLVEGMFGQSSVVAEGKARRRKGEERNPEVGYALAVSRALEELHTREVQNTEKLLQQAFGE